MTNNDYIAILMKTIRLNEHIWTYLPSQVIEGTILEDEEFLTKRFVDIYGKEYMWMDDIENYDHTEEYTVGFVLSYKDLVQTHAGLNRDEVKKNYYDKVCADIYFGFYTISTDLEEKIYVCQADFDKVFESLCQNPLLSSYDLPTLYSKLYAGEIIEQENDQEFMIALDKEGIEDILNSPNFNIMKQKLQIAYADLLQISSQYQNFRKKDIPFTVELCHLQEPITGEGISHFFNQFYSSLIEATSLEVIEKQLENGKAEISKLEGIVEEYYLSNLIKECDQLLNLKDITLIKERLKWIKEKVQEKRMPFAPTYDQSFLTKPENLNTDKKIEKTSVKTSESTSKLIDIRKMKAFFDAKIIGQEEAKKDVISTIVKNSLQEDTHHKNSCLLIGPTGSGKTLLLETVQEYLQKPMVIIDSTQLTIPGYVGASIEEFLERLLACANGDIERAENGIVVLDEIDKKGSANNDDISGKGVLNTLLPFLQGTSYNLKYNGKKISFNTAKLTVFFTGSFAEAYKKKNLEQDAYKSTHIGFAKDSSSKIENREISSGTLEIYDLEKYGNMPIELLGRISKITQLKEHNKESLRSILTESNISPLLLEKKLFLKLGIDLQWTDDFLEKVVEKALLLQTGARSLKATIEYAVKEVWWEVCENYYEETNPYSIVVLTESTVNDNTDCQIIDKFGETHNLKEILKTSQNPISEKKQEKVLQY